MSVNLNDYEFALPNTIYGTTGGTGASQMDGSNFLDRTAEEWTVLRCPPGKMYKIERLTVTGAYNGMGATTNGVTTYCRVAKSVNSMDWSSTPEHSAWGAKTYSEDDYSLRGDGSGTGSYANTLSGYDDQNNRLWMYIAAAEERIEGTGNRRSMTDIITPALGPVYMTGGDVMQVFSTSGANGSGENEAQYFDFQGPMYTISYIEYY